jgi:hypothetical protein
VHETERMRLIYKRFGHTARPLFFCLQETVNDGLEAKKNTGKCAGVFDSSEVCILFCFNWTNVSPEAGKVGSAICTLNGFEYFQSFITIA